jgi:hypothetical protein
MEILVIGTRQKEEKKQFGHFYHTDQESRRTMRSPREDAKSDLEAFLIKERFTFEEKKRKKKEKKLRQIFSFP